MDEFIKKIEEEGLKLSLLGKSNRSKIYSVYDAKTKVDKGIALKIIPHKKSGEHRL